MGRSTLKMVKRYPPAPALFPIEAAANMSLDMLPQVKDPTGRGARAWNILKRLPITEGEHAGKRIGDNAPPWMPRLTILIFGHTDEAGLRVLREVFASIGKKSAKTSFAAAVAMTWILLEEEQRADVVLLAENRFQARIAFDSIVAMLHADEELAQRFAVVDHRHTLRYPRTSSRVRAIPADLASLVGFNPSLAVVDELHLLGRTPKGAKLVNQVRTGNVARKEPLLFSISTAPTERSEGIFQSTLGKARRVIAGEEVDPHFFGWLCEIPEHLDAEDPANWHWSNPSLGFTVTLDRLIASRDSAKSDPEALRDFNSQNLNIQPDASAGLGRWIPLAQWDEAADDSLTLDALLRECKRVGVGADAGGLDDPAAVAVIGETDDGRIMLWSTQWISRQGYNKRKAVNAYDAYVAAGELMIFDGGGGDIEGTAEVVATVAASKKLLAVGIDSYGAAGMAEALKDCGAEIVSVPQSWKLTPAVTWIERRLADGVFSHNGSTMLRWNIGNVVIERRGNAVSVSKATVVGAGKIDGVAAALTAVAAFLDAITRADSIQPSIYSNPESYAAAFGRAPQGGQQAAVDGRTWDPEVLADMRHPLFAEHKARFERWQDARADRDEF